MYRGTFGKRTSASSRKEEIEKQERLLFEKKRQIEERLKSSSASTSEKAAPPTIPVISPTVQNVITESSAAQEVVDISGDQKLPNLFENDGSFMEKFRQMQEMQRKSSASSTDLASASHQQISEPKDEPKSSETNDSRLDEQRDDTNSTSSSSDDLGSEESKVLTAIERSAIFVAMNGLEAENFLQKQYSSDSHYRWLFDKESTNYQYFERRQHELKNALERNDDNSIRSNQDEESYKNELETPRQSESTEPKAKKQKSSRWGSKAVSMDMGLVEYAMQVYGSTDLSETQWKQLEDQRKMKVLVEMMRKKRSKGDSGKVVYEYDSDEDTEGGTWEHKRRMQEMESTRCTAEELSKTRGHHIGDFLPPDQLEKFMRKWDALKDGKTSHLMASDYQDFKIKSGVGFNLLQKQGWKEGESLGAGGTGITEPINIESNTGQNAGLGLPAVAELKEGDDEYEAYRKRMMVAYRFRPNPLNNPRRDYY